MFDRFKKSNLPNFLIIGAQKSGTSALSEILSQHPQVMGLSGEVHFFDVHYHLGVEWYQAQFPKTFSRRWVVGEKSPYYLYHPLAPKRAHALVPNAKIIVLLRNPIDRAYSQYCMNLRNNREHLCFADAVKVEDERLSHLEEQIVTSGHTEPFSSHRLHSYVSRGRYLEQLKRWLTFYPSEQVKISFYEDFQRDPKSLVDEMVSFLGLAQYDQFDFKVGKSHVYPAMHPSIREKLSVFFHPHNQQLELFLGKRVPWM